MEQEIKITLMEELTKIWDAKRAEAFLKDMKVKLDEDQYECLEKMGIYITEEIKGIEEERLEEVANNLDTFDSAIEFLDYFFRMTQPDIAKEIMETLNSDTDEIIDMLDSMEDQGIIQYLAEFGSFFVWFK